MDFAKVLARPLITGASVSADRNSTSPGKKLALRHTTLANIKLKALGGRPGVETIKTLSDADFKDRTIIFALDFFFWDSTFPAPEQSLKALKHLATKARESNVPLVLGDVPALLPMNFQPGRDLINQAIHAECSPEVSQPCFCLPFERMLQHIRQFGYFTIAGKRAGLREIVPDGLHLSEGAGNELADRLAALLKGELVRID